MKSDFDQKPWRSFLPDVFNWLDKVQLNATSGWVSGAHHAIPVSAGEGKAGIEVKAAHLDDATKQKIQAAAKSLGWSGKSGSLRILVDNTPATLVPVASIKTQPTQLGRQWGLDVAKATKDVTWDHLVLCETSEWSALSAFDGYSNGLYDGGLFKGEKKPENATPMPANVSLLSKGANAEQLKMQREMGKAIIFSMMLQDAPPNWLTPVRFGDIAADMAKDLGLKCEVLNKEQIAKLGMGSFISVSNGSNIEPRLIKVEIDGRDNSQTVALVGKGLTFDSGGTSLKPALGMGEMKYDMSGGAAVLATAMFLGKCKPATKVVCLIGAVENILSAGATRPSDVVKSMSGKTIEILNTDAEGRLVLCDVMHYARTQYKPALMIDIATLTGAVLYALGHAGAGLMVNEQKAADYISKVARETGEPLWQLPLWPELEKEVKSEIADLANIAKPSVLAGTCLAGTFLKEFAGDTPWAHVDIAGTGWQCSATGYPSGGASAYGVRLLSGACLRFEKL